LSPGADKTLIKALRSAGSRLACHLPVAAPLAALDLSLKGPTDEIAV